MNEPRLARRAAAEFIGTAFLTVGIIGSGIAASRLSHGDPGFTLAANALATGLVLVAIILALGPLSGGQLNPAVTLVAWMTGGLSGSEALTYALAQLGGAILGAIAANVMSDSEPSALRRTLDPVRNSGRPRSSRRSVWSW